jgi:hypothetical protein
MARESRGLIFGALVQLNFALLIFPSCCRAVKLPLALPFAASIAAIYDEKAKPQKFTERGVD